MNFTILNKVLLSLHDAIVKCFFSQDSELFMGKLAIFCLRFVDMVTQHFGSVAASTVCGFGVEQYPLLIVGLKNRSAMEICSVIQGE